MVYLLEQHYHIFFLVFFQDETIPGSIAVNDHVNPPVGIDRNSRSVWEELMSGQKRSDGRRTTCQMKRSVPAEFSDTRDLITWILFVICNWQLSNYISDSAISTLLHFLCNLFAKMGKESFTMSLSTTFPTSLYKLHQWLGIRKDDFECVICCPDCYKLYNSIDDIRYVKAGKTLLRRCTHTTLDNTKCNGHLVAEIKVNGSTAYYPNKIYCYKPLISSIEQLLQIPGFEERCEEWRGRTIGENMYADIYDGHVWKSFVKMGFLSDTNNYALQINVDWFQPYKRRSNISIGVIYMVVMNLPREVRYKQENLIIVGIIPNLPKEPDTLETFLRPLVEELKTLWMPGVKMNTYKYPEGETIRCALLCAAADIPAARKLCGFLSHAANLGCSRCLKEFSGGRNRDCSGFDRYGWQTRSYKEHMRKIQEINCSKSMKAKKKLESKYGVRYSPLVDLPYFNPVRFCIIDPMHNLFLGTSKRMWKTWLDKELLKDRDLKVIDERLLQMKAGLDAKWAPTCISSNAGSWTAHEWKNWTLISSSFCLKGLLEDKYLKCWEWFTLACRSLTKTCITSEDLAYADQHFLLFCKNAEKLYGKSFITPNIHLHNHLKDCVTDYGSVYGFWLFSFERYNGMLGDTVTNNRNIEVQLMKRFSLYKAVEQLKEEMPERYHETFAQFLGNSREPVKKSAEHAMHVPEATISECVDCWENLAGISLKGKEKIVVLDEDEHDLLLATYRVMYPHLNLDSTHVGNLCKERGELQIGPELYGSSRSKRLEKFSWVMASWYGKEPNMYLRPATIQHFICHNLQLGGGVMNHIFAAVKWHKAHTDNLGYNRPLTVWKKNQYEMPSMATYLPVQRIHGKFGRAELRELIVVAPLPRPVYL